MLVKMILLKTSASLFLIASLVGISGESAHSASCDEVKGFVRVEFSNISNFSNDWRRLTSEAKNIRGKEQEDEMIKRMDAVLIPALRSFERLVELLDEGLKDSCFDEKGRATALEMRRRIVEQLKKGKETGIPF